MHLNAHSSIIYNGQDMETSQVSLSRWMNKEDVVYIYIHTHTHMHTHMHTHTHIYIQWNITQPWKEWNFAICNNMDGPGGIMLSEMNQILYVIPYMWNLKSKMNEYNQTEADSQKQRAN